MRESINILPLIAEWISEHPKLAPQAHQLQRRHILQWLQGRIPSSQADLAADCLIAAGIGREAEQQGTVYCSCSYT